MPQNYNNWASMLEALNIPQASFHPDYSPMQGKFLSDPQAPVAEDPLQGASPYAPSPQAMGGMPTIPAPRSIKSNKISLLPMYPQKTLDQLMNKYDQGISGQQSSLENLKKYASQIENAPLERDYSALMMASDAWNDTNFLPNYKAPETRQDRLKQGYGMAGDQLKGAQGISQSEIDALKTKLGAESDYMKLVAEIQKASAKENKPKELTATNVLNVNEGRAIPARLEDVNQTIQDNLEIFGLPTVGIGSLAGRLTNPEAYEKIAVIDADLRSASQQFGRYMEGGVLRKEDEEKYRKMFPQTSDKPEVAKGKLEIVSRLLQQKYRSDLGALESQNFDVTGLNLPGETPERTRLLKPSQNKIKVGHIEGGYRYQGGDPSDPKSWGAVK